MDAPVLPFCKINIETAEIIKKFELIPKIMRVLLFLARMNRSLMYRVISCFIIVSIYISTFITKQLVLIDVVFEILISEAGYLLAAKKWIFKMSYWLDAESRHENGKEEGCMNKKIKLWVTVGLSIILFIFTKNLFDQKFDSVESLQSYMKSFGIAAPLFLTVFQAVQVVIPVLPGYFGCAAGAVAFGCMTGFLCNYIGISLGSIAAFFLAKKYGVDIVLLMFPQKQYEKWRGIVEKSKSYERFLFIATLLPLFPDDFLCYFSGLMKMDSRKFVWIIILGKPWCILVYSYLFGLIS